MQAMKGPCKAVFTPQSLRGADDSCAQEPPQRTRGPTQARADRLCARLCQSGSCHPYYTCANTLPMKQQRLQ